MKLTSATAPLDDYRIPAPPGAKPRHDYPWASDRFHTGILKGVIALHAGFAVRGINYAFWLDERTESYTTPTCAMTRISPTRRAACRRGSRVGAHRR